MYLSFSVFFQLSVVNENIVRIQLRGSKVFSSSVLLVFCLALVLVKE